MQRVHRMPFGAELQAGGGTRFRLWAPALSALALRLDGLPDRAMTAVGDGWFETVVAAAGAGARYVYALPDGGTVPDPASRRQPDDVHGPSEVVDPAAFAWTDAAWRGRPFEEAVFYELHVGAFTPAGTFDGVTRELDRLARPGRHRDRADAARRVRPGAAAGATTASILSRPRRATGRPTR